MDKENLKKVKDYASVIEEFNPNVKTHVFANSREALEAIRSGMFPNVTWDERCEEEYQKMLKEEQSYVIRSNQTKE